MKKKIRVEFYEKDLEIVLKSLGSYMNQNDAVGHRKVIEYVINRIYRAMGVRLD